MTAAVIYARSAAASVELAHEHVERQTAELAQLARRRGYDVVATFVDEYRGWTLLPQPCPGFDGLLDFLDAGDVDVLLMTSRDRLPKGTADVLTDAVRIVTL